MIGTVSATGADSTLAVFLPIEIITLALVHIESYRLFADTESVSGSCTKGVLLPVKRLGGGETTDPSLVFGTGSGHDCLGVATRLLVAFGLADLFGLPPFDRDIGVLLNELLALVAAQKLL